MLCIQKCCISILSIPIFPSLPDAEELVHCLLILSRLECFHVLLFLTFSRSNRTIHNGAVIIPATVKKREKKELYNTCFILSSSRVGYKILYLQELITQINPGATSSPITVVFSGPCVTDVSTSARFVRLTLHCVNDFHRSIQPLFSFFFGVYCDHVAVILLFVQLKSVLGIQIFLLHVLVLDTLALFPKS